MKNKLLKHALILGALMGCMATAAWAGNVEVDWVGGNTSGTITDAADGFYMTHQSYESRYSTADEGGTYQSYFDANGNEMWGSYTYKNDTSIWRFDYDKDGYLVKAVEDAVRYGNHDVTMQTFTYTDGVLTQSRTRVNVKEQIDDSTFYYTYGDHKITVVKGYANENGNQGDVARYEYTLDDNGNVIQSVVHSMVNGQTNTTTYSYDAKGNLIEEKVADTGSYLYEYNDKDLCVKQTWKNSGGSIGTVTNYEYDANGNLVTSADSQSNTYRYTYAPIPEKASESDFTDVKSGEYYFTPVIWATAMKITDGVGDGKFAPDRGCTRDQLVTFLWRAAGEPEPETTVNPFTDVKEGDYFYKAVLWAVENGVTTGKSATIFAPKETCTRAQIVTFIYRAAGEPKADNAVNPFEDVAANAYYADAVLWAVENGITTGKTATRFAPNDTCTRGQGVTFLYRGIGLY